MLVQTGRGIIGCHRLDRKPSPLSAATATTPLRTPAWACARRCACSRQAFLSARISIQHRLQVGQPLLGQGCTGHCVSWRLLAFAALRRHGRADPVGLGWLDAPLAVLVLCA